MERFVIRQNIEHYREMLKTTTDPARRAAIEKLLREEEPKLKKYDEDHKGGCNRIGRIRGAGWRRPACIAERRMSHNIFF